MQRAVVIADTPLGRRTCGELLTGGDISVAATAPPGEQARSVLARAHPDLAVVALREPAGLPEALDVVGAASPEARPIVLAAAEDTSHVVTAFQHGARGMLSRQRPPEELLASIRRVAAGEVVVDPLLAAPLVLHVTRRVRVTGPFGLSRREESVIAQLPQQLTNAQIGERMGISSSTVRTHLRHALRKLGVADRVEAALLAVEHGLT